MKKLAILSLIILFVMAFIQSPAQVLNKEAVKKEIKTEKEAIKTEKNVIKTEKNAIKAERKELRKLEGTEVSISSKNAFVADFGNVTPVRWKREIYFDEATFTRDGKEMKAFYDNNSKLVGTTSVKTFADLPESARKEIETKYKDYTIGKIILFDDNEANETDMVLWNTQFDDADNYFLEMTKNNKTIILQVNTKGELFFFKQL